MHISSQLTSLVTARHEGFENSQNGAQILKNLYNCFRPEQNLPVMKDFPCHSARQQKNPLTVSFAGTSYIVNINTLESKTQFPDKQFCDQLFDLLESAIVVLSLRDPDTGRVCMRLRVASFVDIFCSETKNQKENTSESFHSWLEPRNGFRV